VKRKTHPDAVFRAKVIMRPYGFGRIHADWFHEPSTLIGADAHHREIGRPQPRFVFVWRWQ
jgi:hypothetical protein